MDYQRSTYFPFGFHLRRDIWHRYRLHELVGPADSPARPLNVRAVRQFTQRVNEDRSAHPQTAPPIGSGELLTLGILTEVLRFLLDYYCIQQNPGIMATGLDFSRSRHGHDTVDRPPSAFVHLYPPQLVEVDGVSEDEFLRRGEGNQSAAEISAREMALLNIAMANPAVGAYLPLFSDDELRARAPYVPLVLSLEEFFAMQPPIDLMGEPLFEVLRAPMRSSPHSLEGQLEYIRAHWGHLLPRNLLDRMLVVAGILKEETLARGGFVPGMAEVLRFGARQGALDESYPEFERFSPDADWMSNVVLIAKSVYVWLDQLSKQYGRHIHRLDQIPDEELDRLARWGFTGLWLIGLWERSPASARIKHIMGNPDAVSSAYSLYDYVIAADLGGPDAYGNLRDRARTRGIRLASDMVPNHMGIYSRWVIEHPDWFLSLDHPPYPGYQFTGADLSQDPRVTIQIEDGYWTHRDAAVVFKRTDNWTGSTKYIYHGNDGTSMPWNDTAQLNYLLPEVREAVIQTILHVARQFPIIRFDAAMTLAKKHFQRLWFPKPGDAGAIPSRAEHGMSRAEFDAHMPVEFWREVVDRVAQEVPDTLLLAEAFWLMEGYFVRTLGMHRVYNSAFMNMLKMEQNANYRTTVRNVLEFSPEILKRFVNFMNNPDERTAIEQFGKGDKYFGNCLLMVTMPGLPMFGHGQIEGYTEKYGMEYRRAYWDEQVDEDLVRRHEAEIFPLMRRRYLFSGVEHFAFYDFHTPDGWIDENVFAYSNRVGDQRSIVFYNNAYNSTSGWIKTSTGLNTGRGDEGRIVSKTLAESLGLRRDENIFYIFRDTKDGLEYIRHSRQLCDEGLFVHLGGYQYHVFLDFREVQDHDGSYAELAWDLQGRGVANIEYERRARRLAPLLEAFRAYFNPEIVKSERQISQARNTHHTDGRAPYHAERPAETISTSTEGPTLQPQFETLRDRLVRVLSTIKEFAQCAPDVNEAINELKAGLGVWDSYARAEGDRPDTNEPGGLADPMAKLPCLALVLMKPVGLAFRSSAGQKTDDRWLDEWLLDREIRTAFEQIYGNAWEAENAAQLTRLMLRYFSGIPHSGRSRPLGEALLHIMDDTDAQKYLQYNQHKGITYLNREQLLRLVATIGFAGILDGTAPSAQSLLLIRDYAEETGYRVDALRERIVGSLQTCPDSGRIDHSTYN